MHGQDGHAEVVQVEYDPSVLPYEQLLDIFWNNHDPTTLNRQGPDVGVQYRSAVFFHTPEQEVEANAIKEKLEKSGRFKKKIVTEIRQALLEGRGVSPAALPEMWYAAPLLSLYFKLNYHPV